jgi:hypothetical protein
MFSPNYLRAKRDGTAFVLRSQVDQQLIVHVVASTACQVIDLDLEDKSSILGTTHALSGCVVVTSQTRPLVRL